MLRDYIETGQCNATNAKEHQKAQAIMENFKKRLTSEIPNDIQIGIPGIQGVTGQKTQQKPIDCQNKQISQNNINYEQKDNSLNKKHLYVRDLYLNQLKQLDNQIDSGVFFQKKNRNQDLAQHQSNYQEKLFNQNYTHQMLQKLHFYHNKQEQVNSKHKSDQLRTLVKKYQKQKFETRLYRQKYCELKQKFSVLQSDFLDISEKYNDTLKQQLQKHDKIQEEALDSQLFQFQYQSQNLASSFQQILSNLSLTQQQLKDSSQMNCLKDSGETMSLFPQQIHKADANLHDETYTDKIHNFSTATCQDDDIVLNTIQQQCKISDMEEITQYNHQNFNDNNKWSSETIDEQNQLTVRKIHNNQHQQEKYQVHSNNREILDILNQQIAELQTNRFSTRLE